MALDSTEQWLDVTGSRWWEFIEKLKGITGANMLKILQEETDPEANANDEYFAGL